MMNSVKIVRKRWIRGIKMKEARSINRKIYRKNQAHRSAKSFGKGKVRIERCRIFLREKGKDWEKRPGGFP
jgi:hypothetical protein